MNTNFDLKTLQNQLVEKHNQFIEHKHYEALLKIENIDDISKEELLSKFITYINKILNASVSKTIYDTNFDVIINPRRLIHRLAPIMFPACIFKFGDRYEVATIVEVYEKWSDTSIADWIFIPCHQNSPFYQKILELNKNKKQNIYYACGKKDIYKPPHVRQPQKFVKPINVQKQQIKPKFPSIKPAMIDYKKLTNHETIIEYQMNLIKELYKFF